jgi:hypothetical protein
VVTPWLAAPQLKCIITIFIIVSIAALLLLLLLLLGQTLAATQAWW